jgi:hypothetical protein
VDDVAFAGYVLVGPLPDQPVEAPVYRWPAGPVGVGTVRQLAGVLSVTAAPARHAHGWVVTGATGELRLRDDGREWSYARADRVACPPTTVDVDSSDFGGGAGCGMAVAPGTPVPAGPTPAAARAAAAPLLAVLGLAPAEVAAAAVSTGYGDATLSVSPTVDGRPTQGLETTVYVDRAGVTAASGRLGPPTSGDVYPLRTAKQAFDELATQPRAVMEPYCGPIPASDPGAAVPPVPCPSPVPVRITGARLGLLLTYDMSGGTPGQAIALMVPAWFFTEAGTGAGSGTGPQMIAIDPAFLAPPVQPQPTVPIEAPGEPESGSAGSTGVNTPASAIPPPAPHS